MNGAHILLVGIGGTTAVLIFGLLLDWLTINYAVAIFARLALP